MPKVWGRLAILSSKLFENCSSIDGLLRDTVLIVN